MKRLVIALALVFVVSATAPDASGQRRRRARGAASLSNSLKDTLVRLERGAWAAWSVKNPKYFRTFLADDAFNNGRDGVEDKEQIIRAVADNPCQIKSHAFLEDTFKVTAVDDDTAFLTYKAMQDYVCDGKPGPSPVWVTTLYVRRGGKWLNMFYQETEAAQ